MGFDLDPPGLCYKKPFHMYYYNKPKLPPLKEPKPIDYKKQPAIPMRYNNATKMRNKVIKEYSRREMFPFVDYATMSHETIKALAEDPSYLPRDTKTTQYRYKFVRDIPVVSCRFTEHVMMFRKPPFSFEKQMIDAGDLCGRYKMRKMMLHEPIHDVDDDDSQGGESDLLPSILQ